LGEATKLLQQILDTLHPWIAEGVPMVVLEPSCLATFRDELTNLFPANEDAMRLSHQTFLLSEFLQKQAADFDLPKLHGKALVHGHCHHKSIIGMGDEEAVLKRLGLEYEMPDTGCCGMAGAFGFEAQHYDISIAAGERVLLPAVREAPHDEYIIADGFSCREQIAQTTDRRALHLAEVLRVAIDRRDPIVHTDGRTPEQALGLAAEPQRGGRRRLALAASVAALGASAGAAAWWRMRRTRE
ncbi:MAG: (Fe-S)-binding protein, partial [Gemmatimonadaceae bacterium]